MNAALNPTLAALLLLVAGILPPLQAQTKPARPKHPQAEWQKALEILEGNAVKDLLPLSKLLENEILDQTRMATAAGDRTRITELNLQMTLLAERQKPLATGKLWQPPSQQASWDVFSREALGKRWSLEKTQAVKGFKCEGKDLLILTADGQEFRHASTGTALPRVYASRRVRGSGYSVYLVSPDLKQALCVVVNRLHETMRLPPKDVFQVPAPAAVKRTDKDTDLLAVLTASFNRKQLEHEERINQMLIPEARPATQTKNGLPSWNPDLMNAVMSHRIALSYLASTSPAPPPLTAETFSREVPKATWTILGLGKGMRWQFDGKLLRSKTFSGEDVDILPTETVWPGLVHARTIGGQSRYLVVSDDLKEAILLPASATFPGKLVE